MATAANVIHAWRLARGRAGRRLLAGRAVAATRKKHHSWRTRRGASHAREEAMPHAIPGGWSRPFAVVALVLAAGVASAQAQGAPEVYNANASLKTAGGAAMSAPVVISISRWTTDAERAKARETLKTGDGKGLHA